MGFESGGPQRPVFRAKRSHGGWSGPQRESGLYYSHCCNREWTRPCSAGIQCRYVCGLGWSSCLQGWGNHQAASLLDDQGAPPKPGRRTPASCSVSPGSLLCTESAGPCPSDPRPCSYALSLALSLSQMNTQIKIFKTYLRHKLN